MNWLVFVVISYLALVLQLGLKPVWMISLGGVGELSPSLMLIVVVYVALHAPTWVALWCALGLGLVVEMTASPMPGAVLVGPVTLGYLAAAYAVLQLRGMVFRESLIAFIVLVLIGGLFQELVAVALLSMREVPWPLGEVIPGWSAADQLMHRFLELLYTAALAIPLGLGLMASRPLWRFAGRAERRT